MFPKELTWKGVEGYLESRNDLILMPIGSMEGHGYHLPLNTDAIIAEGIADRVACDGGFISLPPITYTIASLTRPGNVEMSSQTFQSSVSELVKSFASFGARRFVIVLGHGGPHMKNSLVAAASNLVNEDPSLHISMLHISRIVSQVSSIDTTRDRHAGEWETSFMLYLKPEVVGERREKDFSFPSRHGVIGDPTIATKDKGRELTVKTAQWINDWIAQHTGGPGVHWNW